MSPRRWTSDHLVATVEALCAVVVIGYCVSIALTPGTSPVFPLLLAAVVGGGLLTMAVISRRKGSRTPPPPPTPVPPPMSGPTPGPGPSAASGPDPMPSGSGTRVQAGESAEVRRIVDALVRAGVLTVALELPDAALPGHDITPADVLSAFDEQLGLREPPGSLPLTEFGPLAFHDSHTEQLGATLREQVADLIRLGGLTDVAVEVELEFDSSTPAVPTTLVITDGRSTDGPRTVAYVGATKYLSTVVHSELARLLRRRATGTRLAWTWNDQGVWITALTGVGVDELNADLGSAAGARFTWVDEEEPIAAGERDGRRRVHDEPS